jgi:hypothetical protein
MSDNQTEQQVSWLERFTGVSLTSAPIAGGSGSGDPGGQCVDSNAGQPDQSDNSSASQPNQSIDPNAGQPDQSDNSSTSQPNQSIDPNAGQQSQSSSATVGGGGASASNNPYIGTANANIWQQGFDAGSANPDAENSPPSPYTPESQAIYTEGVQAGREAAKPSVPQDLSPTPGHLPPLSAMSSMKLEGVYTDNIVSADELKQAGYQFWGDPGGVDHWINVAKSTYLILLHGTPDTPDPDKGGGSGPNPPPPITPDQNPDIKEARGWADDFEKRFNALYDEARKLKAMRRPDGSYPAGPFNDYFSKLKKYDDDMESVEKDMQIWRKSMVTDDETQALEEQIDRITKVKEHEPEMDLEDP